MEFFNPNDYKKREQEMWNDSTDKVAKHMKEHWGKVDEKETKERKVSKNTLFWTIVGVIVAVLIGLLFVFHVI